MFLGNEIPPRFKEKWDNMNSRPQQIKLHKEKIRMFLKALEEGIQDRTRIYEEAKQRLEKLL